LLHLSERVCRSVTLDDQGTRAVVGAGTGDIAVRAALSQTCIADMHEARD
jgi:hypothetical protein